jgi:MGT family glycosyltransferase
MSRFLFVVPPLTGHINPTVAVAAALRSSGHEVAWAGYPDVVGALVGPAARVYPCAVPEFDAAPERTEKVRGPSALKLLWESFLVPLTEAMAPGVRAAVDDFAPDVVVADQQALAGALVAGEAGLPWATSATTSAELTDPLGDLPLVADWVAGQIAAVSGRLGLPAPPADPRFSPHLVLVFSTRALTGDLDDRGGTVRMVGPALTSRPAVDFPWDWLPPDRPAVLVSLGTVSAEAGARFLDACRAAVRSRPGIAAVVVDPLGGDRPPSGNVLTRARVPQLGLLPRMRAVVCHAGHNTVCESLWHGVPLVVAPIRDDQPIIAAQVTGAGAGVRLRFTRAGADQVGAALDRVLTDPAYAGAAARIGDEFRAAGGAGSAARALSALASQHAALRPEAPARPPAEAGSTLSATARTGVVR